MSDSLLEKSLDDIIGENKPARDNRRGGPRRRPHARVNKPHHHPQDRRPPKYISSSSIPGEIAHAADGRPILRVKNIHHDLNGEDLSNLFSGVATVEFIKFDPERDTVAYVCFESNNTENNSIAISKFDGKKAMGKILIVENSTSLADRIIAAPRKQNKPLRPSHPRKNRPARKPRPAKKSLDDLDDELSAYMNSNNSNENQS